MLSLCAICKNLCYSPIKRTVINSMKSYSIGFAGCFGVDRCFSILVSKKSVKLTMKITLMVS